MSTRLSSLALVLALAAGTASAQVARDPAHPRAIASILTWRGEEQSTGFRTIEKIFRTHTIRRGGRVHPLPKAAHEIAATFAYAGKTWTVDDYMKAYRVSGLLVLKDGQI